MEHFWAEVKTNTKGLVRPQMPQALMHLQKSSDLVIFDERQPSVIHVKSLVCDRRCVRAMRTKARHGTQEKHIVQLI